LHRRRQHEIDLIDGAITSLSKFFAWKRIDLAGLSGGGHIVACLLARRTDVRRAVIASGNLAVRQRCEEIGLTADVTGFSDFVDPIDLVDQVAKHRPEEVVLVTDPDDCVIPSRFQKAYADRLRAAGCDVYQRFVMSKEQTHHILFSEAICEVFASVPSE
jgi:acetyl esterase/lipase